MTSLLIVMNYPAAFFRRFASLLLLSILTANAAEYPRNQAIHVTMRDGVRIAIDVWLPDNLEADAKLPTLMQATRYWRAYDVVSGNLEEDKFFDAAERINAAGYALVLVDARGSGASFGWRPYERSIDEAKDYGEVVDWIVEQSWSDGNVGAFGISYAGNTAELLLQNRHPAVKAAAPLFNDFDNYSHLAFPGNALEAGPLTRWANVISLMDKNDLCGLRGREGAECDELLSRYRGVKPVDGEDGPKLLVEAITEHERNVHYLEAAMDYEFRDDPWGEGGVIDAGFKGSPAGHLPAIEASGTPMFVRAGWQDAATVNGTLGRYNTISNTQQVIIGPWDHGANRDADPFNPPDTPVTPDDDAQWEEMLGFFDRYLKPDGEPVHSSITYYTLGAGTWSRTTIWPPEGFEPQTWYLQQDGGLSTVAPTEASGGRSYEVDFSATTGRKNRWFTNNGGGGDIVYGDRAAADRQLLTFTSSPFDVNTVITGHPVITLHVTSTHTDGLFIAYLEDVAPDGRVTYITEGQLRALMRNPSEEAPPYWKFGPHRSELRADAVPLVPGEPAVLEFELWATSVLIGAGHRLRIAIAGADADTFLRYPRDGGEPTIEVLTNAEQPSHIVLPVRKVTE